MIYWLQVTSARGPAECCWVAAKVALRIISEANEYELKAGLLEAAPGEMPETIKSALLYIEGENSIPDFISRWKGTVQWIGKSMFRPNHKRKNWFVGVNVFEPLSQNKWKSNEIKTECMRSSGPGGQHVNKVESAVRVTHIPSGLTAIAREERSQHLNKKLAMVRLEDMLREKEEKAKKNYEQKRWNRHNTLERGNAVRVFEGMSFKEKH